jgi:hypothetical protein
VRRLCANGCFAAGAEPQKAVWFHWFQVEF